MIVFLIILFLYPAFFTTLAVFSVDPNLSPVILLLFLIYTKRVSGEDIGRIEHKIDSIFKSQNSNADLERNYNNLHSSAWEHDYPMQIEEPLVKDSKSRQNALAMVDILNQIVFFFLSAYWVFITLA